MLIYCVFLLIDQTIMPRWDRQTHFTFFVAGPRTLRCLINIPRLLIYGFFSNPPDFIRTPRLLIFKKLNLLRAYYVISFLC